MENPPATPNEQEADTLDLQQKIAFLQQTLNSVAASLSQISASATPTSTTAQGSAVQNEQQLPPAIQQNVNPDLNALPGSNQISHNFAQYRDRSPDRQSEMSYRDNHRPQSRNSLVTFYNEIPSFLQNEKPPTFDGKKFSPPQFLEKLQEYFEQHEIMQDKFRLACAKRSLEKHYEVLLNRNSKNLKNYDDFEAMFLEEFWSTSDRLKYREQIFKDKFRSVSKNESLYSFFRNTLDKVEKYYPEIPFEDFKLKFTAQIPSIIALFVKSSNIANMTALSALIKSVDDCGDTLFETKTAPKRENDRRRSPDRHASNEHYHRNDNQSNNRGRGDLRHRPYNNKSRGNWNTRYNEQRVNMIHGFEHVPHQQSYYAQPSHYRSRGRGRGGYNNRYNWNAQKNRQYTNNLIETRLTQFQDNISKLIYNRLGDNSSQQPRHEMGGTQSANENSTTNTNPEAEN
jgi:hypothetical protein